MNVLGDSGSFAFDGALAFEAFDFHAHSTPRNQQNHASEQNSRGERRQDRNHHCCQMCGWTRIRSRA